MPTNKILIVDDEPDIREFIRYNLDKAGFDTLTAENGQTAIKLAGSERPDLILLDIMMPGIDGVETCHELRKDPGLDSSLIAFLTARNEEYSEIAGLNAGADDYIHKPIRTSLLLSRVNALLRRREMRTTAASEVFNCGDLEIDGRNYQVFRNNQEIKFSKKEFEILKLLASTPGRVYSREEIFKIIWGYTQRIPTRTIDVHISKIREKIGSKMIKTVTGIGYRMQL